MGRSRPIFPNSQQQPLPQLSLPQPQLQPLLPPKAFPLPQQQQIRITMMMSHRQEQLLFPLLKHITCHLALQPFYAPPPPKGAWPRKKIQDAA